jgi:hypothetical protein
VLFCVVYVMGMGFLMAIVSGYFSATVGVSASPGSAIVIMSLMFAAGFFLLLFDKRWGLDLHTSEALVIMLASMVTGIAAMLLLVGLASIIGSQAEIIEDAAVPDAAPTTEPSPAPSQANPLADAGVVPDIAAEPSPSLAVTPDMPPPPGNAPPGP